MPKFQILFHSDDKRTPGYGRWTVSKVIKAKNLEHAKTEAVKIAKEKNGKLKNQRYTPHAVNVVRTRTRVTRWYEKAYTFPQ